MKAINYLNDQSKFMYSYRFMLKFKTLIKKNLNIVKKKYNLNKFNDFCEEIKSNSINFITNYKVKYMDENCFLLEDIYNLKKIIDTLIDLKYEINTEIDLSNNNNYLYVVNKSWIIKAKFFIENYIKAKEQKINKFYEESFDPNFIYNSYFNENDTQKKQSPKVFYAFPGPVNNFEITSFKDYWYDPNNLDENDMMKKGMKLNEDYFLVNKKDWKIIKSYFGYTNEIKRKNNNIDLAQLKFILFDKRIDTDYNNINLLKQKYIQLNKDSTIKHLKEKIIHITDEYFKDIPKEEKELEKKEKENNINKKLISFYILDKNKRKLLIEICFSFIIGCSKYDSLFIDKIDLKDENPLNDLYNKYNKEKHILIIEIYDSNEDNYFVDLKSKMSKEFKCTVCHKIIENLKDKYYCEICNLSLYCTEQCSKKSNEHIKLDKQLLNIFEKKFILSDLLSLNLKDILQENKNCGIVGLYNMGNTCYFNSALQCLSNTEDLTKYFLIKYFRKEINNGSSLGSKGFISEEYYKLIYEMWNGENGKLVPKEFRINFCRKTGLFLNSEQQDSQEFLLAVLDNLHEDLNRITNKKYMELQEKQKGESDEKASQRWWDYYKSREDSIIVDLFQGQYKSTIKCSKCGNSSTSYDTYMNIGLPIPNKKTQNQIKLLTAEQNFIDLNIRIDEDIELKDVIKKATIYLNKKKYIEYIKNKKEGNTIFDENNIEIPPNILYNNIEVIEFNKGFKMTNIFKTLYENINKNNINKSKEKINQPIFDNLKINDIYKMNNDSELILFEKNLNFEKPNYCDIYIYPIREKKIDGIFSSSIKKIILSYPVIITLNNDNTFENLESLINNKFQNNLKNEGKNSIELCFPHFTKGWGRFKIQNGECPICKNKYEKSKKYCSLFNTIRKNTKISDLMNNQNKGRPLILYAKSEHYKLSSQVYSGLQLFDENSKNKNLKINLSLYDSFDLFNKEEILEGDNMWFCNKCKHHQNASKKIEIYRTPIYLIIQLKRFKHMNNFIKVFLGNKNETLIDYKEILNLREFVVGPDKDKSIYSLYGVIVHKKFMNGGHYYAYCKNNGLWITYNDERLSYCKNPIDKDAYLLFYKRKKYD